MHIIFFLHFVDPRNFTQLKDPRRELEISKFSYLSFLKTMKRGSLDLFILSSNIFPISKNKKGNNMTFPKFRKNEDLINKSNFGFFSEFIALGKNACFQKLHFRPRVKFILFDSFLGVGENLLY